MTNIIKREPIGLHEPQITEIAKVVSDPAGTIVSPTKVGYIIMTTGAGGLERKFDLKQRPKKKPGVVLCAYLDQLEELAVLDDEIRELYASCWKKDILLGCILPWKDEAIEEYVPKDGSSEMMMDGRKTSCFVIKYGTPSEAVARKLWLGGDGLPGGQLSFASSANPSGKGNRGVLEGVGERILSGVDLAIEADDYVRAQQPGADEHNRHEQGVMVSMVGSDGKLTDIPVLIRKGLQVEKIMAELAGIYDSWDYRHGSYY